MTADEARTFWSLWSLTSAPPPGSPLRVRRPAPARGRSGVAARGHGRAPAGLGLAVGGGELGATGPDLAGQAVADHPEQHERTEGHHDPDDRAHPGGPDGQRVEGPERHAVEAGDREADVVHARPAGGGLEPDDAARTGTEASYAAAAERQLAVGPHLHLHLDRLVEAVDERDAEGAGVAGQGDRRGCLDLDLAEVGADRRPRPARPRATASPGRSRCCSDRVTSTSSRTCASMVVTGMTTCSSRVAASPARLAAEKASRTELVGDVVVGVGEARGRDALGRAGGDVPDGHQVEPRLLEVGEERRGVLAAPHRRAG